MAMAQMAADGAAPSVYTTRLPAVKRLSRHKRRKIMNPYDVIREDRKKLVDKIIEMMRQGTFGNAEIWNSKAMRPQNPLTNVRYRGGNRMRLMAAVVANGYTDPRWATHRQIAAAGYHINPGEHGIICEKWIYDKEVKKQDSAGNIYYEKETLQRPRVSYFRVFNAQQASGFPEYDASYEKTEIMAVADRIIRSSRCPVRELAQEKAYYSPAKDEIILPLRSRFKDDVSFLKTLVHECCHSTAAPDRLNRQLGGVFGSPEYAKEELRAEIGALFTETDLHVPLQGEHYEDHSDYLRSWISILQDDYNEFFRACSDAEQISQYLLENYSTVSI